MSGTHHVKFLLVVTTVRPGIIRATVFGKTQNLAVMIDRSQVIHLDKDGWFERSHIVNVDSKVRVVVVVGLVDGDRYAIGTLVRGTTDA
jgi:hypothetical protein